MASSFPADYDSSASITSHEQINSDHINVEQRSVEIPDAAVAISVASGDDSKATTDVSAQRASDELDEVERFDEVQDADASDDDCPLDMEFIPRGPVTLPTNVKRDKGEKGTKGGTKGGTKNATSATSK